MKPYKHIIYLATALSLLAFFVTSASADRDFPGNRGGVTHGMSHAFNAGEKAGYTQALSEFSQYQCTVNTGDLDAKTRAASEDHAARLMNNNKTDDYIRGFQSAYVNNWHTRMRTNCGG
ncbi:MAG: hypothetical protein GY697_12800 [Desulfobacterales bacterium]|nr:hypothetical protein [Desulfobacterales bacterium]